MTFEFASHPYISDVKIIKAIHYRDDRGWFMETYSQWTFANHGNLYINIVQENHSKSIAGVFRGLHYQKYPYDQGKLIRVISGRLIDYFMDLRLSSPTFGEIHHMELSPTSPMLWIPRGFAHGIHILEDDTEIIYKVDNRYAPLHECGIDPRSVINLPDNIILSDKDRKWSGFIDAVYFP